MSKNSIGLQQINASDRAEFASLLSFVFEGAPAFVVDAWSQRPFATRAALHDALCAAMYGATPAQHLELIRAHPDLVGRAALLGTLSPASTGEQAAAGLDRLTPDEIATFGRLNQEYRDQFGFPFVICARENKKESILTGFAARLGHSQAEEVDIALGEIAKIASLRLVDTIRDDDTA